MGLSSPAVAERLQRLESEGCITGYRTDVDPKALGYALSAVIRVRPASRQLPRVAELARSSGEVVECHRITGEDCFFMKAHVRSIEHLEELIDRFTPVRADDDVDHPVVARPAARPRAAAERP